MNIISQLQRSKLTGILVLCALITVFNSKTIADNTKVSINISDQIQTEKAIPDSNLEVQVDFMDDDLLLFEDIPIVISASRQSQKVNQTSVPVTIITKEDIYYSGINNIPEILLFYTGIDVIKMDNLRYGVGVRGLHGSFSDRTLLLIDGRSVNNPAWGGVEWFRLPVMVEDIDRIEVVRGPGGAAWGANAFNGVINIITKTAKAEKGVQLTTTLDQWGQSYTNLRYAGESEKMSWRQSFGYQDLKTSEDTVTDEDFESRDFNRSFIYDGSISYQISEDTDLALGLNYSYNKTGDFETMGYYPQKNNKHNTAIADAKITHDFSDTVSSHLRWSGYFLDSYAPNLLEHYRIYDNDIENQFTMTFDNHELTLGGNIRFIQTASTSNDVQEVRLNQRVIHEYWAGLFAIDRWKVNNRLTLEGQLRGDYNSEIKSDWSGRLTGLYSLDDNNKHIMRLSTAKAFRSPFVAIRGIEATRVPIPLPAPISQTVYGFSLMKAGDLENEEISSLEAGYSGNFGKNWTIKIDGYYQKMRNLIGSKRLPDPYNIPGRFLLQIDNIDGAESYGMETEVSWKNENTRLSTWYAFNQFNRNEEDQSYRAFAPALHKIGFNARFDVAENWILNTNYRMTSTTWPDGLTQEGIPETNRLDLTLTHSFSEQQAEIMVGVQNLLSESGDPIIEPGMLTAHDTMGRVFFGRLQVRF